MNGRLAILRPFFTVFQSYQYYGKMKIKVCKQWKSVFDRKDFGLQRGSNLGSPDLQATALRTTLPGLLNKFKAKVLSLEGQQLFQHFKKIQLSRVWPITQIDCSKKVQLQSKFCYLYTVNKDGHFHFYFVHVFRSSPSL